MHFRERERDGLCDKDRQSLCVVETDKLCVLMRETGTICVYIRERYELHLVCTAEKEELCV